MAESKGKKREFSKAALVPGQSVAQLVISLLLDGLKVQLKIDNKDCEGYVHQLDFSKDGDHVFASVAVPDPENEDESIYVRVSISRNGEVILMAQGEA